MKRLRVFWGPFRPWIKERPPEYPSLRRLWTDGEQWLEYPTNLACPDMAELEIVKRVFGL